MNNVKRMFLKVLTIVFICCCSVSSSAGAKLLSEKLEVVPLFESCSFYYPMTSDEGAWTCGYREKGTTSWQKVFAPVFTPDLKVVRGSIVNLKEHTAYEIQLSHKGKKGLNRCVQSFTTWRMDVPIAKTIYIENLKLTGALDIKESGTAKGWIKITSKNNTIIKGGKQRSAAINIIGKQFIILEGLTIRGGIKHGITIENSNHIRVINCDIAGFGRVGTQRFDLDGKYYTKKGKPINYDAGVNLHKSKNLLVERCWIHDPRSRANTWQTSHPSGPTAIALGSLGSTVIRYNDVIGGDGHRWNDGMESRGDGSKTGGVYRDADIYGNMFAFGQDDGIELDGGQMNVKLHHNKFVGFLCGISTAPCLLGPSFVYRNVVSNLGDVNGDANTAIKNNHGKCGSGRINIFNNTVVSKTQPMSGAVPRLVESGYDSRQTITGFGKKERPASDVFKIFLKNNILLPAQSAIASRMFVGTYDFNHDLIWHENPEALAVSKKQYTEKQQGSKNIYADPLLADPARGFFHVKEGSPAVDKGIVIDNFVATYKGAAPDCGAYEEGEDNVRGVLPLRPLDAVMDTYSLSFDFNDDKASKSKQVTLKGLSNKFSGKFTVCINDSFKWLKVTPVKGRLAGKKHVKFSVKIDAKHLPKHMNAKGAFLVRFADGLSRPVFVFANKKHGKFLYPAPPSKNTQYFEAEGLGAKGQINSLASGGKAVHFQKKSKQKLTFNYTAGKDEKIYIFSRIACDYPTGRHDSFFMSIDGGEPMRIDLKKGHEFHWGLVGRSGGLGWDLKKGDHVFEVTPRESVHLDMFMITDDVSLILN